MQIDEADDEMLIEALAERGIQVISLKELNGEGTSEKIINKLYAAFGTDSGCLFGLRAEDKAAVVTIVNWVLDELKEHVELI